MTMTVYELQRHAAAARRRVEAPLLRQIDRARRALAASRATLTMERRRHAAALAELERTYGEAKEAGASYEVLYWLTLSRVRAKRA